eukprot:43424-Prorocentrum_minimum.AAC.1
MDYGYVYCYVSTGKAYFARSAESSDLVENAPPCPFKKVLFVCIYSPVKEREVFGARCVDELPKGAQPPQRGAAVAPFEA